MSGRVDHLMAHMSCPSHFKVRLNYSVPNATAVTATLVARRILRKFEFNATLITHYEDKATSSRPLRGFFRIVTLDNIAPIYSPPRPVTKLRSRTKTRVTKVATSVTTTTRITTTPVPKKSTMRVSSMVKSYRYPLKDKNGLDRGLHGNDKIAERSTNSSDVIRQINMGIWTLLVFLSVCNFS